MPDVLGPCPAGISGPTASASDLRIEERELDAGGLNYLLSLVNASAARLSSLSQLVRMERSRLGHLRPIASRGRK